MKLRTLALASAALALSASAQAATYTFTFTDFGSNLLASGSLTTLNTLNAVGGYDITGITGSVTGYGAITGLVNNPNQPFPASSSGFIYDNVLFTPAPHFTTSGVLFTTSGVAWNIYRNGTDVLTGFDGVNYIPNGSGTQFAGTFTLAAVPEPATWGMLILGFAAIGAGMRRRTTSVRFATA